MIFGFLEQFYIRISQKIALYTIRPRVYNWPRTIGLIGLSQILACTEVYLALGREGELVLKIVFKSLVSRTQSGDHDLEIYKPFIYLVLLLIYLWIALF